MTLVVGMPVSLSGQFQVQGRQALAGLQAWARDVNDDSPGTFRIIYYDDASDRSQVKDVTRRLIVDDHVDILIGPYSTVLTTAAAEVAESLPGDEIIFVPDIYFAENLARELEGKKKVIYPGKNNSIKGAICEVHEQFTLEDILAIRKSFEIPKGHANRMMYVHWECKPEVLQEADYYGSTTQIRNDIAYRVEQGTLEKSKKLFDQVDL